MWDGPALQGAAEGPLRHGSKRGQALAGAGHTHMTYDWWKDECLRPFLPRQVLAEDRRAYGPDSVTSERER